MSDRMSGDVAMCLDDSCPSACKCLRYLAVPARDQNYADHGRIAGEERCAGFIPLTESGR